MKKIAFILLTMISFSCSKESDSTNNGTSTSQTEPAAYFKYKINGALIEMNGSLSNNSREGSVIRKTQQTRNLSSSQYLNNSNYIFKLIATKNYFFSDEGQPLFEIVINSPTLSETSYSHRNNQINSVFTWYPNQSGFCGYCTPSAYPGQEFTVTILKITNGYAEGTFSGILKQGPNNSKSDIITEGEFKNVKILQ